MRKGVTESDDICFPNATLICQRTMRTTPHWVPERAVSPPACCVASFVSRTLLCRMMRPSQVAKICSRLFGRCLRSVHSYDVMQILRRSIHVSVCCSAENPKVITIHTSLEVTRYARACVLVLIHGSNLSSEVQFWMASSLDGITSQYTYKLHLIDSHASWDIMVVSGHVVLFNKETILRVCAAV